VAMTAEVQTNDTRCATRQNVSLHPTADSRKRAARANIELAAGELGRSVALRRVVLSAE